MSIVFYRRPDYVAKLPGHMSLAQCQAYVERTQKHRRAIPSELSFDNVVHNKALAPCALQDFMQYLVYVSHDAENLQFWLWIQDYTKRFYASSGSDQALSPPWSEVEVTQPNGTVLEQRPRTADKRKADATELHINFETSELTPRSDRHSFVSGMAGSSRSMLTTAEDANAQIGLKWQSFTIQPFRSEINLVISHYLASNSPRELNLSHQNRAAVLHTLQHTTHPSAFSTVTEMVETTLRNQSHPNFIRWSICNGNKPRVLFVQHMGVAHIIGGFILGALLVFSDKSRWWRLFVAPLFFVGFAIGIAAYKGLCMIIHLSHRRALRPWEQFGDGNSSNSVGGNTVHEANPSVYEMHSLSGNSKKAISLDAFGMSNDYGHEPWVEKYKNLSLLRKIFCRQAWIQDRTIRVLQDRIAIQSYIWSFLITFILTALFTALPQFGLI